MRSRLNATGGADLSPYWPAGWSLDPFTVVDRMRAAYYQAAAGRAPGTRFGSCATGTCGIFSRLDDARARGDRSPARARRRPGTAADVLDASHRGARARHRFALGRRRHVADAAGLRSMGSTDYFRMDLESGAPPPLARHDDAMVLLHVLEHLQSPDALFEGVPAVSGRKRRPDRGCPDPCRSSSRIWGTRSVCAGRAKPYGHLSGAVPGAHRRLFAEPPRLTIAFLSGAFFMRLTGRAIENCRPVVEAEPCLWRIAPVAGARCLLRSRALMAA